MEEGIKQDGQKTVVAFITGLLIGGLLVWVFSASSDNEVPQSETESTITDNTTNDTTEQPNGSNNANNPSTGTPDTSDETDPETSPDSTTTGEGDLSVSDQSAGGTVVLDNVDHPTSDGWIVVHDYEDGELGNALGAARYSTSENLLPEDVDLLRVTETGNTYFVAFYTESGDRVFDLDEDFPITSPSGEVIGDTFTAE